MAVDDGVPAQVNLGIDETPLVIGATTVGLGSVLAAAIVVYALFKDKKKSS